MLSCGLRNQLASLAARAFSRDRVWIGCYGFSDSRVWGLAVKGWVKGRL